MILVDTTVWIDFFRGTDTRFGKTLHALLDQEEDLCLTGIHLTEILQGIRDDFSQRRIRRRLLSFPIYQPKGVSTYLHAADIYRNCRKKGKTVRKTVDCIIAAIAIENNLRLFHNDRDFNQIARFTRLRIFS
ncbi:MAG TPA: PIN domain nuclease [Nitrospiria bacterium]